jgi:hypothetical protein
MDIKDLTGVIDEKLIKDELFNILLAGRDTVSPFVMKLTEY